MGMNSRGKDRKNKIEGEWESKGGSERNLEKRGKEREWERKGGIERNIE